jgi:hypothetical protein
MDPAILEPLLGLRSEARTGLVPTTGLVDVLLDLRNSCTDHRLIGCIDEQLRVLSARRAVTGPGLDIAIRNLLDAIDEVERTDPAGHVPRWRLRKTQARA